MASVWTPERRRRYMRLYMRERFKLLASLGICTRCGKTDARPGKRECRGCVKVEREYRPRKLRRFKRAA